MGYSTDFSDEFRLNKVLTPQLFKELNEFAEERHGGNTEPYAGFPGFWCNWVPTEDMQGIEWNGAEKFYNYTEWLELIIEKFLAPNGYVLNGRVEWQGEENDDFGIIVAKDNVVRAYEGQKTYPGVEPEELTNHIVFLTIKEALEEKLGMKDEGGGDSPFGGIENVYSRGNYKVTIEMRN